MFVDYVKVTLVSGKGGNGIVAFRHEKYVPLGGPSGGDGGNGGSIIFEVDTNKNTLLDLRYSKRLVAENGENGKPKKMHGANGKDLIIKVPLGTIVKNADNQEVLADLKRVNQKTAILSGGKGGRGNFHFTNSRNTAADFAENGENGITVEVIVELKILADCGLVGLPSAGKSTLLSVVSNATPQIADYHFTTLVPNLGLVAFEDSSFVMADLPGIIEDAHLGKGLGIRFLKHIERCRLLIFVLDLTSDDPVADYQVLLQELKEYNPKLLQRPKLIAANKIDSDRAKEKLAKIVSTNPDIEVFPISALFKTGLKPLLARIVTLLKEMPLISEEENQDRVIYRFDSTKKEIKVVKTGEHRFRVSGYRVDRLLQKTNIETLDGMKHFSLQITKMGIDKTLRELGAIDGDLISVGDFEFEFRE